MREIYFVTGSGHRQGSNLSIHIPAGIESGKTVRLKGQGNPGRNGGAAGDVLLNVNVTPSSEFERKGQNVYSTIRVPFTTATLGGRRGCILFMEMWSAASRQVHRAAARYVSRARVFRA